MELMDRMDAPGPKRILALDGGGIRGAITLGFLEKMESILRERHDNKKLVLSDYFDLIGGTSTGAIIAAALAIGKSVKYIKDAYLDLGEKAFSKKMLSINRPRFKENEFEEELKRVFENTTIGDKKIRTGLCIIAKRADTGSTWIISNHPRGKFYEMSRGMLIREVIRASTAAPTFFTPQKLHLGGGEGAFIDGGVSMHNNPALQLFLLAVLKGYRFEWKIGSNKLLVVSVGTGVWESSRSPEDVIKSSNYDWATEVPSMLMDDASWHNQIIMQLLSNTQTPWHVDEAVESLKDDLLGDKAACTYLRYDVRLEPNEMSRLGFPDFREKLESLRDMSYAANRFDLTSIGTSAANEDLHALHFPEAFDRT